MEKTEILFVTAGMFLEMLKQGAASLQPYGAVIIDEVHERSCENDCALACLIQLALHCKELRSLKIILMSATADVRRYSDFMQPLCTAESGRAGQYAIGDSATVYNTTKRYLKDALIEASYSGPMPPLEHFELGRASLPPLCELMARLVIQLVSRTITEDGLGGTVLVFVPTYRMIEMVHDMLERGFLSASLPEGIPLYVLHSSVDIDDSMAALRGEDGASARVVIASAVAESSITIKNVTHVVDSCRACEIRWEAASGEATPHIVWVSQAQAKQRAGRTGRTNHGTVWMLATKEWVQGFSEFEPAALQLNLLRKEFLLLTAAQPKQLNDARRLLASCLDAPTPRRSAVPSSSSSPKRSSRGSLSGPAGARRPASRCSRRRSAVWWKRCRSTSSPPSS